MTAWNGVLALTLVARDEEDILAANLDYHLSQGVDVVLVVDHGSTDRTPEILAEYAATGRVVSFRDDAPGHDQAPRVNRLLRVAADSHGADWVIHCDADEFWMPTAGTLRDVFAAVPNRYGYMRVERVNFIPAPEDGRPFHQCMVVRELASKNGRGHPLEPKVAQRPAAAAGVTAGNHDLEDPVMEAAPDIGAVEVLHFPSRGYEQFEHKVVKVGTGLELFVGRPEGVGVDQLELLELHRRGELRQHYEAQLLSSEAVDSQLKSGELILDDRLQKRMRADPERREESPEVQMVLRRAWAAAGKIEDARLAAEEQNSELWAAFQEAKEAIDRQREEIDRLVQTIDGLRQTIETIRASRVMRYTAAARGLYHRLRS